MPRKPKTQPKAAPVRVHVRWMIRRDMPEILVIEEGSYVHGVWGEEDFLRCLRQRNCIGMVAELMAGDRGYGSPPVLGFMIYELHRFRLHVLNLAVHPLWRRRGVGQALTMKLASKLSSHRRVACALEVRETNLAAQFFLAAQGYRALHVQRGFYDDTGEDAYTMAHCVAEQEHAVGLPTNRLAGLFSSDE